MMMRRLSLVLVLVAALAGCSSGSSNVATSTKSTSPTAANPTSAPAPTTVAPTSAPPAADSGGGEATSFCDAFKQIQAASASGTPAAFGATFQASANAIRKYAPAEIKDAAGTYADLLETIGTAARAGTMDEAALQKALAAGLAGKAADIGKVAVWVSTNCKL